MGGRPAGDRLVDVNLLADAGIPAVFEVFGRLLQEAEEAADAASCSPGPRVPRWWPGAGGCARSSRLRSPVSRPGRALFPWPRVREEQAGPARERLDAARREALSHTRRRAEPGGGGRRRAGRRRRSEGDSALPEALSRTIEYVGARRALLSLLGDDNETVAVGAHVGFAPDVVAYWRSTSLSADLPSSEAIRTGRPLFFRTMAELDGRYPIFLSTPAESDPGIACVPLRLGRRPLRLPGARLRPGARLQPRGGVVPGADRRRVRPPHLGPAQPAWLACSRRERDQAVARAVATLATAEGDQIWDELVGSVVACVADGASAHSVGENGTLVFCARPSPGPGASGGGSRAPPEASPHRGGHRHAERVRPDG